MRGGALLFSCLAVANGGMALFAQSAGQAPAKLDYIVYLSRHGVRSPATTATAQANMEALSVDPWPDFGVPLAYLTAHGRWLMQLQGVYNREYLLRTGLLAGKGCADADRFYFWSDNNQRDIESGRAMAFGMFPECQVPIHSMKPGTPDPLFVQQIATDRARVAAALGGRIGDNPRSFFNGFGADADLMQRVLLGCDAAGPCPKDGRTPKRMLLADVPQPAPPAPPRDRAAELTSLAGPMSTVAEAFLLEYEDGMPMKDVGWGRVDEAVMERMMSMRASELSAVYRTPYTARAASSNLLSHLLRSMEQAVAGEMRPGSIGRPGDKALMLLAHDGTITALSGALDIAWIATGYPPNEAPPDSALVFEIWRDAAAGKRTVRTYVITETPSDMRAAVPLSLEHPPTRTAVFVPGCSTVAEGYPCDWEAFRKAAEVAIDPAFSQVIVP